MIKALLVHITEGEGLCFLGDLLALCFFSISSHLKFPFLVGTERAETLVACCFHRCRAREWLVSVFLRANQDPALCPGGCIAARLWSCASPLGLWGHQLPSPQPLGFCKEKLRSLGSWERGREMTPDIDYERIGLRDDALQCVMRTGS